MDEERVRREACPLATGLEGATFEVVKPVCAL